MWFGAEMSVEQCLSFMGFQLQHPDNTLRWAEKRVVFRKSHVLFGYMHLFRKLSAWAFGSFRWQAYTWPVIEAEIFVLWVLIIIQLRTVFWKSLLRLVVISHPGMATPYCPWVLFFQVAPESFAHLLHFAWSSIIPCIVLHHRGFHIHMPS